VGKVVSMRDEPDLGIVLWATDVPALAQFLSEVAGLPITEQHPGLAALAAGPVHLQIHADEAYRGHPWYDALQKEGAARGIGAELRFRVADVDRAYRRALVMGGVAVHAPFEGDNGQECHLLAPDGYLISLWCPAAGREPSA
jgi:predicted enzyme related to lactoylglutathione lyase